MVVTVPEDVLGGGGSRVGDDDVGTVIPGALRPSPTVHLKPGADSLDLLDLVLPGVAGLGPGLLDLGLLGVIVESSLILFNGDSLGAVKVSRLPPKLHKGTGVDAEGGGVPDSSGAVPSSMATQALTEVIFLGSSAGSCLNKYLKSFVSIFFRTN